MAKKKKSKKKKSSKKKKKNITKKIKKPKKSKFVKTKFDVTKHVLVPKHTILSGKEKEKLFEKYKIGMKELPKMMITDPAIQHLNPKIGDVVKIERKSSTAGESIYYRGVVNE